LPHAMSRAHSYKVTKKDARRVEISVAIDPDVDEKPFQCAYRQGLLEAIALYATGRYATITHVECVHRGGQRCVYIAEWVPGGVFTATMKLVLLALLGVPVAVAPVLLGAAYHWFPFAYASAAYCLLIAVLLLLHDRRITKQNIAEKEISAGELIDKLNRNYSDSIAIREIGEAISGSLRMEVLLSHIMNAMQNRLDYDRGVILLANAEKTSLLYAAGYGCRREDVDYVTSVELRLDNPRSKGPAELAFQKKTPVIVQSAGDIENNLPPRSKEFIRRVGTKAFICVPILYRDEPLGVLMVDNVEIRRRFLQSDVDLLKGIANQIGISINNARSYALLEERNRELQQLHGFLQNVLENSIDAIVVADGQGLILLATTRVRDVLGFEPAEMVGRKVAEFVSDRHTDLQALRRVLVEKGEVRNIETRLASKKGSLIDVTASISLIKRNNGSPSEVLYAFRDIADKKRMEAQLLQAQKMETIGTLAGGIAHDFNNTLHAIVGYTEMAAEGPTIKEVRECLDHVLMASRRAQDLVRNILAFSRQTEREFKAVDLTPIIKEVVSLLRASIPKHIKIVYSIEVDACMVHADAAQIHQVLMNLCTNAAYAIGTTWGEIRIELSSTNIDINTARIWGNVGGLRCACRD